MFMAILRVEMVPDVIWSSPLMLASWPKVKLPPTCGHLKGSARADATPATIATAPAVQRMVRRIICDLPRAVVAVPVRRLLAAWRNGGDVARGRQCHAGCVAGLSHPAMQRHEMYVSSPPQRGGEVR